MDVSINELPGHEGNGAVPLALDLDGTVCRTDTLVESALQLLATNPLKFAGQMLTILDGPVAFKRRMAAVFPLDPATLVYNHAVLDLARSAREQGRPVFLVTAADSHLAEAVAAHLGVFDEVLGTKGDVNLKGAAKATALVTRFGVRGFDYAGDVEADLPVWRQSRRAIVVSPAPALLTRVAQVCSDVDVIGQPLSVVARVRLISRALRVHQWAKNILVFVPLFAGHVANAATMRDAFIAMIAFCFCASSVYVLNDLVDLPHDRLHPRKRERPFASGELGLGQAPVLIAVTLLAGFGAACFLPGRFVIMLLTYYVATLAYSLVLKRRMVWDVVTLAGLYTIRIFAGAAAISIKVSPWLLAFSMFLFFCLAVVKRLAEITRHVRDGETQKLSGRGYLAADVDMLRAMAAASGYMAVLVLALYVNSPELLPLYRHPAALWVLCPILLFWVSRVLMLSQRGEMHDDPVIFAFRDKVSLGVGVAALAAFIVSAL